MKLKDLLIEARTPGTTYNQVKEMIDDGSFNEDKYEKVLGAMADAKVKSLKDGYAIDLLQIGKEFSSKYTFLKNVKKDLEDQIAAADAIGW